MCELARLMVVGRFACDMCSYDSTATVTWRQCRKSCRPKEKFRRNRIVKSSVDRCERIRITNVQIKVEQER